LVGWRRGGTPNDRGAVTVEAALALCSLVLVLALAVGAVAAASAQLRCIDAAREAARLVARGEPDQAWRAAESIAPGGARVDVQVAGDQVTVQVSTGGAGGIPGLTVSGRALGVLEPAAVLTIPPSEQPTDKSPDQPVPSTGRPGQREDPP
jgi:Flp pilus assembly protein TadG